MTPKQLQLEFKSANRLLDGANISFLTLKAAWISFYRIRNKLPEQSLIDILLAVKVPKRLGSRYSWASPWQEVGVVTKPYKGVVSPTIVLQWAARENLFPVFSEPSWRYVRNVLRGFRCEIEI